MTWDELLTIEFELWIDTRSSIDYTLHNRGREVEDIYTLLQIEIAIESNDDDLTCYVVSLVDALDLVEVSDPIEMLTLEQLFCGPQAL